MKVGQVVKLKNPRKKGENKRRWRVIAKDNGPLDPVVRLRRLDTATHRIEYCGNALLAPISFWERLFKRY